MCVAIQCRVKKRKMKKKENEQGMHVHGMGRKLNVEKNQVHDYYLKSGKEKGIIIIIIMGRNMGLTNFIIRFCVY